jgi:hypothetical protein
VARAEASVEAYGVPESVANLGDRRRGGTGSGRLSTGGGAAGTASQQRRAEEALSGCVADEGQLSQLDDASLCHGWAGLVLDG